MKTLWQERLGLHSQLAKLSSTSRPSLRPEGSV